jgi:hypothetical protein
MPGYSLWFVEDLPMSRLVALPALAFGLDLLSSVAVAQIRCQEIRFAPGSSSGVIESEIPPDGVLCYSIEVGDGQKAEATIEGPEEQFPVISIDGITREGGDQAVSWLTRSGTYELYVGNLFRYGANTPFRLRLSVTGG